LCRHLIETKVVSEGRIGPGVAIGLTILQKEKFLARKNEVGYDDQASLKGRHFIPEKY
jgi:hypothetical protein